MKHLLLALLITLLAIGTACGQAPEPEPVSNNGIQVHGNWTVTVTNPDGTVDAVHEFENELSSWGGEMLSAIVFGETTVTMHKIQLKAQGGFVCKETDNDLTENTELIPATLVIDTTTDNHPAIITGLCSVEATEPTEIIMVASHLYLSSPWFTSFPDGAVRKNSMFTRTDAADNPDFSPIPIGNGQTLSFNVVISFS